MVKVYIASPYTKGDMAANVRKQLEVANELMSKGFAPYVPLLSHFQDMMFPRPYEDWIKLDLEWVKTCDCLLRLPGESKGADGEVAEAVSLGIPVYFDIDYLLFMEAPLSEESRAALLSKVELGLKNYIQTYRKYNLTVV